jgi:hypothetical protein
MFWYLSKEMKLFPTYPCFCGSALISHCNRTTIYIACDPFRALMFFVTIYINASSGLIGWAWRGLCETWGTAATRFEPQPLDLLNSPLYRICPHAPDSGAAISNNLFCNRFWTWKLTPIARQGPMK